VYIWGSEGRAPRGQCGLTLLENKQPTTKQRGRATHYSLFV